jgi:DNA-binding MarR family transcriptional regulator
LVLRVLESGDLLTQKDIIIRTYLPARTVRYALNRLKRENLLKERFYFHDARQSLYGLKIQPEVRTA